MLAPSNRYSSALRASIPRWASTAAATVPAWATSAAGIWSGAESTWSAWASARSSSPARSAASARRDASSIDGRTRVDGGGVELARAGEAGAQRLVGRRDEHAGDPVADRPGAEQAPGRGEDVAAAVELQLRQRASHLHPGRGRRPLQHRRRDQRDRRAVGGEQAFRAGRLHQLVEGGGVGGDVGAQQGHEQVGLQRGAQRPGPQELAHPGGKAVDGVAQLGQEAAGRAGRVPTASGSGRGPPARSSEVSRRSTSAGSPPVWASTRSTTASEGRAALFAEQQCRPWPARPPDRAARGRPEPGPPRSAAPSADMPSGRGQGRWATTSTPPGAAASAASRASSAGASRCASSTSNATSGPGSVSGQLAQHGEPARGAGSPPARPAARSCRCPRDRRRRRGPAARAARAPPAAICTPRAPRPGRRRRRPEPTR